MEDDGMSVWYGSDGVRHETPIIYYSAPAGAQWRNRHKLRWCDNEGNPLEPFDATDADFLREKGPVQKE